MDLHQVQALIIRRDRSIEAYFSNPGIIPSCQFVKDYSGKGVYACAGAAFWLPSFAFEPVNY